MANQDPTRDRQNGYGQMIVAGGKRVTAYDPANALVICQGISEGKTLKEICTAESGLVSAHTFQKWCKLFPAVQQAYQSARQLSAQAFEEKALGLAEGLATGNQTAQEIRAREVAMGQWRWSAAKRDPATYGEKAPVNMIVPVQIITSLALTPGALAQATGQGEDIYNIDMSQLPQDPEEIIVPAADLVELEPDRPPATRILPPTEKRPFSPFIPRKLPGNPGVPRKRVLTPRLPMNEPTRLRERPLNRYQRKKEPSK